MLIIVLYCIDSVVDTLYDQSLEYEINSTITINLSPYISLDNDIFRIFVSVITLTIFILLYSFPLLKFNTESASSLSVKCNLPSSPT